MRSSTFSSDRLPTGNWLGAIASAVTLFALLVLALEARLASQGFQPGAVDSAERWIAQRQHANSLGKHALALIGASRIQLGVDLDTLKRGTGYKPVMLAIDGSRFMPILRGLAADHDFVGSVLVDYTESVLALPELRDTAVQYQQQFDRKSRSFDWPDSTLSEAWLDDVRRTNLASYADGARPITSLLHRAIAPDATGQYLRTFPDRSRVADYSKVDVQRLYLERVARHIGATLDHGLAMSPRQQHDRLRELAAQVTAESTVLFETKLRELRALVDAIEQRGGRVYFARMPTSGLILLSDGRRFPEEQFHARFTEIVGRGVWSFHDSHPGEIFHCPDGSHLDQRDRRRFTELLIQGLNLASPTNE